MIAFFPAFYLIVILFIIPIVSMLAGLILLEICVKLYAKGFIQIIRSRQYFIFLNFLVYVLAVISSVLLYGLFDPDFLRSMDKILDAPLVVAPIYISSLLMISPISFVVHNRLFANLHFLFFLLPFLISTMFLMTFFLLIYYPLMIKYTNHLRRKYNINLPIKTDPIIAWFKKLFKKTINKLFKKTEVKRLHKPPKKP